MNPGALAVLIVVDILVVMLLSVAIGAWAPRWPATWLHVDRIPLSLGSFETRAAYKRLGVSRLPALLPEAGAAFGGRSKKHLPGTTAADLRVYLVEVRRAEWVHWLSCLTWLPLFIFNPWWLALAFGVVVSVGNLTFILVLRYNRLRLLAIVKGRVR